jgi:NADH-quinone oxidoreductase subunit C
MSKALVKLLQDRFGAAILETATNHGDDSVVIAPSHWVSVHRFLRDDPACQMQFMMDLFSVDYPDREPRFEVIANLYSHTRKHRLFTKARVGGPEGDDAEVDTLSALWGCANWYEREVWDMMGVKFRGHPDPRRILMYEEFEGHPLRKDYPAAKTQPIVPYRTGNVDKLAPFDEFEGMPFGRQTFDSLRVAMTVAPSLSMPPVSSLSGASGLRPQEGERRSPSRRLGPRWPRARSVLVLSPRLCPLSSSASLSPLFVVAPRLRANERAALLRPEA